eukprot:6198140-Pleurochrysis_carterae.AAC.1
MHSEVAPTLRRPRADRFFSTQTRRLSGSPRDACCAPSRWRVRARGSALQPCCSVECAGGRAAHLARGLAHQPLKVPRVHRPGAAPCLTRTPLPLSTH